MGAWLRLPAQGQHPLGRALCAPACRILSVCNGSPVVTIDLNEHATTETAAVAQTVVRHSWTPSEMPTSSVARRELTVELEQGLHVVPCSQIVKEAQRFPGTVRVIHGSVAADAKSMFDLLGLNAVQGTVLTIEAEGEGAQQAVDGLVALFEAGFKIPR